MIVDKCLETTFSLKGEDKAECIEGFEVFKYLRRFLYFPDNDWPGVLQNIRKAWQVWGRIGKMLRREGEEPAVLAEFYCAVV